MKDLFCHVSFIVTVLKITTSVEKIICRIKQGEGMCRDFFTLTRFWMSLCKVFTIKDAAYSTWFFFGFVLVEICFWSLLIFFNDSLAKVYFPGTVIGSEDVEGQVVDGHPVVGGGSVVAHGTGCGFTSWEVQILFHSLGQTQACRMYENKVSHWQDKTTGIQPELKLHW